ncbi:MAG TPA: M15 family metallopeptidase, partial [Actinomycetes bacterium]|nr:M15 family metallopeptidase [Actinomycetes bacterium]
RRARRDLGLRRRGPRWGSVAEPGTRCPASSTVPPAPADRVLLVWTPGRLPGGLAGRAGRIRGVRAVTVVKGGLVGLTGSVDSDGRPLDRPRPGTTVPLEAIGFDPATYPALLPAAARAAFARLRPGEALLPALAGAMGELRQRDLARLVDPEAYRGCWNPRLTRSGSGVSRHAWGAAVDLNVAGNPTGLASAQDPRLVEVMERWGFTWGGRWLVPDPAHFEWLRSPRPPGPGS